MLLCQRMWILWNHTETLSLGQHCFPCRLETSDCLSSTSVPSFGNHRIRSALAGLLWFEIRQCYDTEAEPLSARAASKVLWFSDKDMLQEPHWELETNQWQSHTGIYLQGFWWSAWAKTHLENRSSHKVCSGRRWHCWKGDCSQTPEIPLDVGTWRSSDCHCQANCSWFFWVFHLMESRESTNIDYITLKCQLGI